MENTYFEIYKVLKDKKLKSLSQSKNKNSEDSFTNKNNLDLRNFAINYAKKYDNINS